MAACPEHAGFVEPLRLKLGLSFPLLVDQGGQLAGRFGLNFDLPEDLCGLYREFGIDLQRFNSNGRWELPMPASYVIDQTGVIRYAQVNLDYTCRPEPQAALAALAAI